MYWRVTGLSTASPVDSILDKDNYTLEELLDEDELIQECKSLNTRLIIFLKQRSSVEALVRYLVEAPAEDDDDAKRRFKYPFAACEVFCCEVEGIFQTLLDEDGLLDLLFSILDGPAPLNSMLAGYFSRVVGCLLSRYADEMGTYLRTRPATLAALCRHCGTTSVAEVVVRLVGAGDGGGGAPPPSPALDWLADSELLPLLLRALGPGSAPDAAANAAEILAAVAQSPGSPLVGPLAAPEVLRGLVAGALGDAPPGGAGPAAAHALDICLALLEPVAGQAHLAGAGASSLEPAIHAVHLVPIPVSSRPETREAERASAAHSTHEALRAEAIACLSAEAGRLADMLVEEGEGGGEGEGAGPRPWIASYGVLGRPVGQARLKAVELLASLLHTRDPGAEGAVMAGPGVQRAQALMLAHPFNNALHHAATRLLAAFEVGSPALVDHLLGPCALVPWLLAAPREVSPAPDPDAPPRRVPLRPLRAGYAGHLTHLANRLAAAAAGGEGAGPGASRVRAALQACPGWPAFVAEQLEPRNTLESVFAWSCGRPSMHGGESFQNDVYQRYGVMEAEIEGEDEEDIDRDVGSAASSAEAAAGGGLGVAWGPDPILGAGVTPFHAFVDESSSSDESSDDASGSDSDGNSPRGPVGDLGAGLGLGPAAAGGGGASEEAQDMDDMSDDAVLLDVEAAEQLVDLRESFERELRLHEQRGGGAAGEEEGSSGKEEAAPAQDQESAAAAAATPVAAPPAEYDAFLFWKTELPEMTGEEEKSGGDGGDKGGQAE